MGKENTVTYSEALVGALSLAVCDLLATERFKMQMLVRLLEQKGILSEAELVEALQRETASGPNPPAVAEEDFHYLQEQIRQRMAVRLEELRSAGNSEEHRRPQ